MSTCTKCGMPKSDDEFYTSKGKRYPSCKACHQAHQATYRRNQGEHVRARDRSAYFRRTYGLDESTIADLVEVQGGVCAVCEEGPPEWVDHDHRTGLVRGLLCKPCNWALGQFRDDPAVIGRALRYVQYYESVQLTQIHEVVVGRNGHNRH